MTKTIFLIINILNGFCSFGADYYVTSFSNITNKAEKEIFRNIKDSQPAEYDPEGNWGNITEGFQISVRFENTSYNIGEPITADILIRNTASGDLVYRVIETNLRFAITHLNKFIPETYDNSRMKAWRRTLFQGTQHKYSIRLNERFVFDSTGEYVITAFLKVPEQNGWISQPYETNRMFTTNGGGFREEVTYLRIPNETGAYQEVSSGNAIIRINNPLKQGSSLRPDNTSAPSLRSLSSNNSAGETLGSSGLKPEANAKSSESQPSTAVIAEVTPDARATDQGVPKPEYSWRDRLLWGTLSFLFLVLAFIFYRAHRRSLRQNE